MEDEQKTGVGGGGRGGAQTRRVVGVDTFRLGDLRTKVFRTSMVEKSVHKPVPKGRKVADSTASPSTSTNTGFQRRTVSRLRRRFSIDRDRDRPSASRRTPVGCGLERSQGLWTVRDGEDRRKRAPTSDDSGSVSWGYLFNSFIAGALAGTLADVSVHPIDTVNTRLKVMRLPVNLSRATVTQGLWLSRSWYSMNVLRPGEGFGALYRGLGPTLMQSLPMNASWFLVYEFSKQKGVSIVGEEYESVVHLCAGAFGELVSSVFYVPFDVVKTRMQLGENPSAASGGAVAANSNYRGTFHALSSIVRTEGIAGLYSGYRACIVADCSVSALQFMFYERLKSNILRKRQARHSRNESTAGATTTTTTSVDSDSHQLSAHEALLAGAASASAAAFLTNPIDTLTARLMTQGLAGTGQARYARSGLFRCARDIVLEEGAPALMRGWIPRTLRFGVLGALTLAVYEKVKWIIGFEEVD